MTEWILTSIGNYVAGSTYLGKSEKGGKSKQNRVERNSDLSVWNVDLIIDHKYFENSLMWVYFSIKKLALKVERWK